jgi:predicted small metal-binding protein
MLEHYPGGHVKTTLPCPCGELIVAKDEDELVEKAKEHLKEKHPELADVYEREHILFMAY